MFYSREGVAGYEQAVNTSTWCVKFGDVLSKYIVEDIVRHRINTGVRLSNKRLIIEFARG